MRAPSTVCRTDRTDSPGDTDKTRMRIRTSILATGSILVLAGSALGSSAALAGNAGDGSGYGTQPGFEVSNSHTACAGHGAFGAFGKDDNFAGGANGQATGTNNSKLCGNPQSR